MKRIINLDANSRNNLFEATARKMKVTTVVVEKDFWVCVVLNYLLNESRYKNCFIFKGGTSLSKCYDIIKRFSEDVDLVLKWDCLGFSDDDVYKQRSKNQDYKFESLMNSKGSEFIQNELKQDLLCNLATNVPGMSIESDPDDPMVLYVAYPAVYVNPYIHQRVKLEIGPVAAKTPVVQKDVEPYCFECFNTDDKAPFKVDVVSIARTFWEKLLILYAETNRPSEKDTPARYSRHYYDVYMIYKSDYFKDIITNMTLFEEVKNFKSKYYRTSWSKLEECSLKNIKIIPSQGRLDDISKDYDSMSEMIFADKPSFEEIVRGLKELQTLLNEMQ